MLGSTPCFWGNTSRQFANNFSSCITLFCLNLPTLLPVKKPHSSQDRSFVALWLLIVQFKSVEFEVFHNKGLGKKYHSGLFVANSAILSLCGMWHKEMANYKSSHDERDIFQKLVKLKYLIIIIQNNWYNYYNYLNSLLYAEPLMSVNNLVP